MHVTNFKSDLTPKQDDAQGSVKSKFGILLSKKVKGRSVDKRDALYHGISEHPLHLDYRYSL